MGFPLSSEEEKPVPTISHGRLRIYIQAQRTDDAKSTLFLTNVTENPYVMLRMDGFATSHALRFSQPGAYRVSATLMLEKGHDHPDAMHGVSSVFERILENVQTQMRQKMNISAHVYVLVSAHPAVVAIETMCRTFLDMVQCHPTLPDVRTSWPV
jgi:hypothetical protein